MSKAFRTGKNAERHQAGKPAAPPRRPTDLVDKRPAKFREAEQARVAKAEDPDMTPTTQITQPTEVAPAQTEATAPTTETVAPTVETTVETTVIDTPTEVPVEAAPVEAVAEVTPEVTDIAPETAPSAPDVAPEVTPEAAPAAPEAVPDVPVAMTETTPDTTTTEATASDGAVPAASTPVDTTPAEAAPVDVAPTATPTPAPVEVKQAAPVEKPVEKTEVKEPAKPGVIRFADLPLSEATHKAIEAMGFTETTPIQGETIPALLEGRDLIGQAQTGTGKTAAFGVPLIEAAREGRRGIVLTPTRELAKQVQKELQAIGKGSPVDVICLIGGAPFHAQVQAINRHPQAIIVATPGRVVDHLGRNTLNLQDISVFVLDEADEMLSMGFQDELDTIVAAMPEQRQTVLFTATLAPAIEKLAKKALHDPATVRMGAGAAPKVRQGFCVVAGRDRIAAVAKILEAEAPRSALLFARTRARVEELVESLSHVKAEALHGGMGQPQRESVMRRFRDGQASLLVATDVAARGLDVETIDLVLHDEPAGDPETYIHRIGRTGRAGRSGTSILFIGPGKINRLGPIRRVAGRLEEYTVPDDQELGAIRSQKVVAQLAEEDPSEAAKAAFRSAIEDGMDAQDIALRALEALMTKQAAPEPEPTREAPSAIALKVGKMDNVHAGAIVGVLTNAAGLRADDVGRIDILEKMSVVEVPTKEVERVCEALGRMRLSGRPLLPRAAEDWRFKTPPGRGGDSGGAPRGRYQSGGGKTYGQRR